MKTELIEAIERITEAAESRELGGWDGLYETDIRDVKAFIAEVREQQPA